MLYGKQTMSARVDAVQADSAAAAAGFQPGDLVVSIDGHAIGDFEQMQRIVSESAGNQLDIKVDRKGAALELKATPALKEIKDNFGNVHRIGILGISRSTAAEDLKSQPVGPLQAVALGAEETWFVVDRTLSYIGGVIVGREAADNWRPDPDCPDIRPGREHRLRRADTPCRRIIGVDRSLKSVSDTAARWRSPYVLCDRGFAGPAAIGTRPRSRVSNWSRDCRHVDDICNFQ